MMPAARCSDQFCPGADDADDQMDRSVLRQSRDLSVA